LTFEAMLNYLYEQSTRQTIVKSINYNQKSYLLEDNYHLKPKPSIKGSCVSDLNLMTELMSKNDLEKSGDLHKSDSNSFYRGLSSKVAVYEDSGIILNPVK